MPRLLLAQIDQCAPWVCRLVARKSRGRVMMTNSDIAFVSRLSRSTVSKLAKLDSWRTVKAETIQAFSLACGVNLMALKRTKEFLRRRKLVLWKRCTPAQRRMLDRLIKRQPSPKTTAADGQC